MVSYASGSIRFSGLGSDYDFDGMVKKLAAIESRQVNQFMQWQKDWKSRLDAIKEIRGELMNLQSTLKKMNSISSFMAKGTTSSDEKVATAIADGDSANVSYSVEVGNLAKYATWTKDPGWYEKNEVITPDAGGSFTYSYKGVYRTVNVPKGTTVEGFLKLVNNDSKNPGVRAQIMQGVDGISFQLKGMDTGKTNTLVIRDVQNINGLGVSTTPGNYTDTENSATFGTMFKGSELGDSINTSSEGKTFVYTVNGIRRSIMVEPGESIQDLTDKINALTPGIARLVPQDAILDPNTDYKFVLQRDNTEYTPTFDEDWYDSNSGCSPFEQLVGREQPGSPGTWIYPPTAFDSPNAKILNDGDPETTFKLTVRSSDGEQPNEQTYEFSINQDTTLSGLVNQIKFHLGERVDVKIIDCPTDPGKYSLQVNMVDKTHRLTVENGTLEDFSYVPPSSAGWDVKQGENAWVRINDVPSEASGKWLEVAGNTLKSSEVVPGITFSLLKLGKTNISVYDDTEVMTENIKEFVDAVNSFRTLLKAYTEYDEEKQPVDPEYSESLFDMQKGGLLQGNYGIQMVSSRLKSVIAGAATGFLPRTNDTSGYRESGDIFSALSQIGITTNANEGEALYGLLEINYISNLMGSKTLDEAMAEDPMAVAELFALQGKGESNSDFFHFDSYVPGITKAGTHEIAYKVDQHGNIYDATINGQPASWDNEKHTITAVDGTAKGLMVNVANYDQMGEYSGTVSIKQGKINDILQVLEGTEGLLGSNGTLRNLEKNYQGIIDGIENKIQREDERLQRWEKNMLLKFSRLETVLGKYNQLQSDIESQLSQLKTSKS